MMMMNNNIMMIVIIMILVLLIKDSNSLTNRYNRMIIKKSISMINKKDNIKSIMIPIISLTIGLSNPIIALSDQLETEKVVLTASEVLVADVKPKVDLLKDVFFTIKLFPTIGISSIITITIINLTIIIINLTITIINLTIIIINLTITIINLTIIIIIISLFTS